MYSGVKGELNFQKDFQDLLLKVGWESVIKNPTSKDIENNFRNIINENNKDKLGVESKLTDGEFKQIMDKINFNCSSPVASNIFLNGRQVSIKSEITRRNYSVSDEIYLDIFNPLEVAGGKSHYQIAEQPIFETSEKYNNRRGDIMLLINGIPVIHIELKASGHSLNEGVTQIQKYMKEEVYKGLYGFVQVFFVATPEDCIYFANTCPNLNPVFMFHWADKQNKAIHDWRQLIQGENHILSIPEAHHLVGYYTCASIEKDSTGCIANINNGNLMVARSYQVHAIQSILKRVKKQNWDNREQQGGYIWGTTGCGKTFTSFKSAQLIIDKNYADKVVFVVDRKELDDQSYTEYNNFARDGEPIKRTDSTRKLYDYLSDNTTKLMITSIQKLSRINEEKTRYVEKDTIDKINEKRIVFIIDEAHRSQFGEMHEKIKNTFIKALFIGFTGTPIFSENDKMDNLTSQTVFGNCLAVYSIASGIRDKNVLGFYPKMVRTFEDSDLRDAIACSKANTKSKEEAKKDSRKWEIYRKYYNLKMIEIEKLLPTNQYNCDEHRKAVVKDIVEKWDLTSNAGGKIHFHAILATNSIPEAIEYYHLFKKTNLKVTALFDPNVDKNSKSVLDKEDALNIIVDDYNEMFGTGKTINREADPSLKTFKKDIMNRLSHKGSYKNISEADSIDIVIVVDQLLTGFDSKYINTLYLDKVLETDGLIQAISRTNRVLDESEKPWGIFKYYRKPYTMRDNIENALRLYCEGGDVSGAIVSDIDKNVEKANEVFQEIELLFKTAKIENFRCLPESNVYRQKFRGLFKELTKICNGMKLQGMNWRDDTDKYVMKLDCCKKWLDGKTRIYNILEQRYKDFIYSRGESSGIRLGYDLTSNLTEIEQDKIDADYLEEHFKQIVPKLLSDIEEDEKERIIKEFSEQLAILSEDDQRYANIIIYDIKDNKLEVNNRTLIELIIKYKENDENQKVLNFSKKYGLDESILHRIYHMPGNHDIEISKLRDTCNYEKLMDEYGWSQLVAKSQIHKKIKEFISE